MTTSGTGGFGGDVATGCIESKTCRIVVAARVERRTGTSGTSDTSCMSENSGARASRSTVRLSVSSGCEEGVLTGDANDTLASSEAACVFLRLSDVVKVVSRASMGARC